MLFQLISGITVKLVDNMMQSNYLCVILHVNPRTFFQLLSTIKVNLVAKIMQSAYL